VTSDQWPELHETAHDCSDSLITDR